MRWGAQCWMLKPLLLNKWTISQLCRFLFAFWGWGLSLCEVSSMLMSDASLSKAYKSGLCRSQNGKWFWSEITHTCHRLIIVVKPESLWRVGTILSQPRLLHHHRADTTKSIWFLFREMLLPSPLFPLPTFWGWFTFVDTYREESILRAVFACYFIQLFNVSDYI